MDRTGRNPFFTYPVRSLLAAGLLFVPLWWLLADFGLATDPEELLEGDIRKLEVYREAEKYLPETETLVVNLRCDDVFSRRNLALIREIGEAFLERPDVTGVKSLTHAYFPVREGFSVEFRPIVPDGDLRREQREAVREVSLSHPAIRDLMVSADARNALITVDYDRAFPDRESRRAFRREVESVLAPFRENAAEIQTLALPLVREELETSLRRDLGILAPAATVLLLAVLFGTFRSGRLLLFVLASAAMYLSLLPGLFQVIGLSAGAVLLVLFPLLGGIHLTLLAHVACACQAALREVETGKEAVRLMLGRVTKSCLFACLTTAGGLLALSACGVPSLRAFGWLGAAGVAFAFLMTFGPGIALLRIVMPQEAGSAPEARRRMAQGVAGQERVALRLARWVERRRRFLSAGALLALVGSLPGLFLLETDIRVTELLSPDSPTRRFAETLDRDYGGVNLLRIELDSGVEGGIRSPAFLRYVWEVERYAAEREPVSAAYSYAMLYAMLNQIWDGGAPGSYALPESFARTQLFSGILRAREDALPLLAALNDETRRTAYVMVRSPDLPAAEYLDTIDAIIAYAEEQKPEGASVSAAEGMHTFLEAERRIVRGQIDSAWLSFAVVGALLLALWRSFRLALYGLLAAALPVAVTLGAAGYLGVSLNSMTIMMAAIVLGVAVDDAVHFITHWRRAGGTGAAALSETFRVKAVPILCTSLILAGIFSLFLLASFPPVARFGLMAAGAFVLTLATVLLCLPAALRRAERPGRRIG